MSGQCFHAVQTEFPPHYAIITLTTNRVINADMIVRYNNVKAVVKLCARFERWMQNGTIIFIIQWHLEPFKSHHRFLFSHRTNPVMLSLCSGRPFCYLLGHLHLNSMRNVR